MYICPHCNLLKLSGHAHPCAADSEHPDDIVRENCIAMKSHLDATDDHVLSFVHGKTRRANH